MRRGGRSTNRGFESRQRAARDLSDGAGFQPHGESEESKQESYQAKDNQVRRSSDEYNDILGFLER